jgi:murein L,D-transpeptidase YafK
VASIYRKDTAVIIIFTSERRPLLWQTNQNQYQA